MVSQKKRKGYTLKKGLRWGSWIFILFLILLIFIPELMEKSFAVSITSATLRFDRIKTNTTSRVLVKFKPNTVTGLTTVRIDFDNNYVIDNIASNIDTSTTALPSDCTALSVTNDEASAYAVGNIVDFAVTGVVSTATTYCFYITSGITTPSTADNEYTSVISTRDASTELGQISIANYFISDDQVSVSAIVTSSFSFTLDTNVTAFTANLSPAVMRSTSPVTCTVVSNAANGWTAYLKSANGSMSSVTASDTIPTQGTIDGTPETLSSGNEYYQLDVDEIVDTGSNGTVVAEYNGGANQGGTFNSSDFEAIVSSTGTTGDYEFTLTGKSTISGITKAANDYADTWTVIAAGNF